MTAEAMEAGPRAGSSADGDRPLRIALLTYKGNPFCGGQGVYVRHLSRELARLGHQVEVIGSQPYPVLDEGEDLKGLRLTELPSLDLYRSPDPFRTPKRDEYRDWVDALEVGTMWTGGFPEPLTFSLRARRHLRARRGEFDIVHDNQTLGYGLLGGPAALGAPSSRRSTTPSPSTGSWRSTRRPTGSAAPPYAAGTRSRGCRSASPAACRPCSPSPGPRARRSSTTSAYARTGSASCTSAPTPTSSRRTPRSPRCPAAS